MQILFFATCESNKLEPIANAAPIPLVPIANRPLMLYPLELLARQDYKRIFVALHNHAGQIESYFGTGERWGVKLHYLLQRRAVGNGGAARRAAAYAPDDLLLIVPADAIIDFDVSKLVAFHQERGASVTVLVSAESAKETCAVTVDQDSRITRIGAEQTTNYVKYDTGVYVCNPEAIDLIPPREYCDIHSQLLSHLIAAELPVYAYDSDKYWNSLSTFEAYKDAQAAFLKSESLATGSLPLLRPYWRQSAEIAKGIWIGRNNVIHPAARLQSPVMIGDNCYIGQGVQLGPSVVVGNNVVIDEEATLSYTTVLDETYVGQLVKLENRFVNKNQVIDLNTGDSVRITDQFLVGRTFQSVSDTGFLYFLERCFAFLLLLALSGLMGLIAFALWLTTRSVFAKERYYQGDVEAQRRSNSISIKQTPLWQFSTVDSSGRQTAFGRWLKQWDLHRLPQLVSVVSGDMALIGVKPLTEFETSSIQEEWQQKRFEYMMGFTGLWYVQSQQSQQIDEIDSTLVADTYYTVTKSWQLDLKILWQTVPAWWRRGRQKRIAPQHAPIGNS